MTEERVRVAVLGPLRVHEVDGADATPAGALQRRLLAALVLRKGTVVSTVALVDAIWSGRSPRDSTAALQTHMFRLRRALPLGAIEHTPTGYRLDPAAVDVDADRLADAVTAALAIGASDPVAAVAVLDGAGASWRGSAYPELGDTDDGRAEATRLDELRLRAAEVRLRARLDLGLAAEVVADAAALTGEAPLRERPRGLLMEALAATGRRVEALRAFDDFRRLVGEELGIEPSPALAELHTAVLSGVHVGSEAATSVPMAVALPARPALPVPATTLVGRHELVAEAVAMAGSHRLLTLLGTGGVGKTRVLLEVGGCLQQRWPDRRVVLCELAGATAATALDVVATAVGVELRAGRADAGDRLAAALGDGAVVLLLDNCEHVLDPMAELAERALTGAPGVTVLATSRERLRVGGEQVLPIPPLPLHGADGATTGAAVQLFVDRARAVRPGFDPDSDELARIADIVRRLDGLPLAIELAAARLQTMEVDEVAAGLDRRFHLLTSGVRTTTRHRSLAAAVGWSYALLTPALQRLFVDLSVFAGPFSAQDAAAVHGGAPVEVVAALAELAERSLVTRAAGGRYALLETLRAFAAAELDGAGRADEVGTRHAACLLRWAQGADQRLRGSGNERVLEEIDAALPDLRVAFAWLVDRGDSSGAGRLVVALNDYGLLRVRPEVLLWAERVWALEPEDGGPLAAEVWAAGALGAWEAGDVAESGRRATRALALVADGGEPPVEVLQMQGLHALFEGRLDDAVRWYERALRAASGDVVDEIVSGSCVVLCLAYANDPSVDERARSLLASVQGQRSAAAAFAWYAAGEAELDGDLAVARQRFDRALELAAATGCSFVTGVAGSSAASIDARIGDPKVAADRYRALLHHWRRAGMWSTQWTMLRSIAGLLARLGRTHDAAVLLGAITSTDAGHRVFGRDAATLADLDAALRAALGDTDHRAAYEQGTKLDGQSAVEHALRALED